jgi:hypothetical protein
VKKIIHQLLSSMGYQILKSGKTAYPDLDDSFYSAYEVSKPFTMTSIERMYSLHQACKYIAHNKIEGDIVECGVWKGGSSMMAALTLAGLKDTQRKIYLYDTYEGMSAPTEKDVSYRNEAMKEQWEHIKKEDKVFAYSPLEEVRKNLTATGYPPENLLFIKGKVEDTIPGQVPNQIALLRLDTDWYESTYHELKHLFPLVTRYGIVIIDDYGHWKGSREATDTYFTEMGIHPLLHRIDYSGRIMIKI